MPLHTGHELMLDFGAAMMDEFHIIVSGRNTDVIPVIVRYFAVKAKFKNDGHVTVHLHIDYVPEPEYDENGTAIDESFWNTWINIFKTYVPNVTHFVSSDMYGQEAAKRLGIDWLPVDPNREMINISGTTIRNDLSGFWDYVAPTMKPNLIKKVAVMGPESVGKTTFVESLTDCSQVIEYGRIISEVEDNKLTEYDFDIIHKGQTTLIQHAVDAAKHRVVVSDTEAYTTYLFGKYYLDVELMDVWEYAQYEQDFDLYILFAPNVPWVNDGTRVVPTNTRRMWFFNKMKEFLKGKPHIIIDDVNYNKRFEIARKAIDDLNTI